MVIGYRSCSPDSSQQGAPRDQRRGNPDPVQTDFLMQEVHFVKRNTERLAQTVETIRMEHGSLAEPSANS